MVGELAGKRGAGVSLASPGGSEDADAPRYYDLKRHPELLAQRDQAYTGRDGEFLTSVNSSSSIFETVKWTSGSQKS